MTPYEEQREVPAGLGFSSTEARRLSACLARLLTHLRESDVAITGGVAIQAGMAMLGREGPRKTVADLDMVATAIDAVSSSVADTFLVSHYHSLRPGVAKFMVQLVDPQTRIRVDIFPDLVGSLQRAKLVELGPHQVRCLALEDIFAHKLLTMASASPARTIDPKHVADATILGELLQRSVPAIEPHSLAKDVYGGADDDYCERCDLSRSDSFPLAPKDEIFRLLGWRGHPTDRAAVERQTHDP
jgi:hypothetical protein